MTASVNPMSANPEETRDSIKRTWWVFLLWGILMIVVGIALLTNTKPTAEVILTVMGAYWVVGGIFDIVAALWKRQGAWGCTFLIGIISILAGLVVIENPLISGFVLLKFLYFIIAFMAIFNGIARIFMGFQAGKDSGRKWSWGAFFLGMIQILFGFLLLEYPLAGTLTLIPVLAIFAIIGGIINIVLAFQVRSLAKN